MERHMDAEKPKKKQKKVPEPTIVDESICSSIMKVIRTLGKDYDTANADAAFYTAYIRLTPTNIEKTISGEVIKDYAKKLVRRGSWEYFENAKEDLLEEGLIAQIVPTRDFRDAKGFGKVPYLPINPKTFFELNEDKLVGYPSDELEVIRHRILTLSEDFDKKFCISALRERCKKSTATRINNITLDKFGKKSDTMREQYNSSETEMSNITIYYSGMWVTYTLADNIPKNSMSVVSMMLNGTRVSNSPQLSYYNKILNKNAKINVIFTIDNIQSINGMIEAIHPSDDSNLIIRRAYNEGYKTNRITIVDKTFALDGRKLIHLGRSEPSYTGTLYLDTGCMDDIKDIFDTVWSKGGTIFPPAQK